ncbi:hypothetical protein FA09DRAFT_205678 [Tilletiopsis washingtonensis]|jgi:hypothetical protein|uniref:Uncharacterized protein n=1 Tax=Tilletiopsis washingtonensis TaxID=58919 RepID=A0A316ZGN8_9BASI|nr:hypothetical protein FA09DRAFT_205678 [Tilletiopsis washingtonensis]PWO00103.1 hypothetical protein FA09DRAFT_205678 [Tilletiopsis washingtonensis]
MPGRQLPGRDIGPRVSEGSSRRCNGVRHCHARCPKRLLASVTPAHGALNALPPSLEPRCLYVKVSTTCVERTKRRLLARELLLFCPAPKAGLDGCVRRGVRCSRQEDLELPTLCSPSLSRPWSGAPSVDLGPRPSCVAAAAASCFGGAAPRLAPASATRFGGHACSGAAARMGACRVGSLDVGEDTADVLPRRRRAHLLRCSLASHVRGEAAYFKSRSASLPSCCLVGRAEPRVRAPVPLLRHVMRWPQPVSNALRLAQKSAASVQAREADVLVRWQPVRQNVPSSALASELTLFYRRAAARAWLSVSGRRGPTCTAAAAARVWAPKARRQRQRALLRASEARPSPRRQGGFARSPVRGMRRAARCSAARGGARCRRWADFCSSGQRVCAVRVGASGA